MGLFSRGETTLSKRRKSLISNHLLPCWFCFYRQRLRPVSKTSGWRQQGHVAVKTSFKFSDGLLIIAKSNPCRREIRTINKNDDDDDD